MSIAGIRFSRENTGTGYAATLLLFLSGLLMMLVAVPGAVAEVSQADCRNTGATGLIVNELPTGREDLVVPLRAAHFVDRGGSMSVDEIAAQPFSYDHCSMRYPVPPDGNLWLRFEVANQQGVAGTWYIGFKEVNIDEVALYEDAAGGVRDISRNGRAVPSDQKTGGGLFKTGVPVQVAANASNTYYLKLSGVFPPVATPVLVTAKRFAGWSATYKTVSMLVLGFTGMMALVSLVVFRHIDPHFYQFYTLYMVSRFGFTFISDGWLPKAFGVPLSVATSMPFVHFFAGLAPLCMVLFCRALLSQGDSSVLQKRVFGLLLIVAVGVIALAISRPWGLYAPLHLFVVITPFVLFCIAFVRYRAGVVHAKWMCAGLACLMSGLTMAMFFYTFQSVVSAPVSVSDLFSARPLLLGYFGAIMVEPVFMMIAISTLMTERQREAAIQMARLQSDVAAVERQRAEAGKAASARIEQLEASLIHDEGKQLLPPIELRFLDRATELTLKHVAEEGFGARELAAELGVSEKTLGRRLKQAQGLSPAAFIRSTRLNKARDLILLRQYSTVAEVAHACGFSSVSHFAKLYRRQFGETPSETLRLLKADAG